MDVIKDSKQKKNFWKKHNGKIGWGIIGLFMYGLVTFVGGSTNCNMPAMREEFNPRKYVERKKDNIEKTMSFLEEHCGDVFTAVFNAPWRAMNMVTMERYIDLRKKAFEIAGIDEKNPAHDAKRFQFYRQLGIAVRDTNDVMDAAYIPFETLKAYVEKNSEYKVDEEWKDIVMDDSYKERCLVQGKAFFKADADENGVADNKEWKQAMHEMGYRSQEEILESFAEKLHGKTKEELKTELEEMVKKSKKDSKYLTGNIPEEIPISKLKEYISE